MKIIYNDGHVAECPAEEELEVLRHSAAHIMAQAVKRLYPDAHFAYGPATEKGFHYDIDLGDINLTDEDLPAIQAEMQKIVKENLPFKVYPLPRDEAVRLMKDRGEIYKVEHIADLHLFRGFGGHAVHLHLVPLAGVGGLRTRFKHPDAPEVFVESEFHTK